MLLLPLACGCSSSEHVRDLGEIFIVRAGAGFGIRASARAGALLHTGIGGSIGGEQVWSHQPYSEFPYEWEAVLVHKETAIGHAVHGDTPVPRDCFCLGLLPPLTRNMTPAEYRDIPGGDERGLHPYRWIQAGDIEVSVWILFLGIGIGFSPGELIDFFTNLFGLDLDPDWQADERAAVPLSPREREHAGRLAEEEVWRWEDVEFLSDFLDVAEPCLDRAALALEREDLKEAQAAAVDLLAAADPCFDRVWPEAEATALETLRAASERFRKAASRPSLELARAELKAMRESMGSLFRGR
ncbi:MAG: hypothetical protein HYY18_10715 [Planctomycetes bacterium]|nr:hypothetical protein [Planctomycetota bacterium]